MENAGENFAGKFILANGVGMKKDNQLIKKAKEEKSAYGEVYRKYTQKIYRYFWYRVGRNKETAEDLTQETFLRAFERLPKFIINKTSSYFSYLITIAHNILVNYYRKPKNLPLEKAEILPDKSGNRADSQAMEKSIWSEAAEKLTRAELKAFEAKYKEGKKIKEIAAETGKTENAVKITLSRARKKLVKNFRMK